MLLRNENLNAIFSKKDDHYQIILMFGITVRILKYLSLRMFSRNIFTSNLIFDLLRKARAY